MEQLQSHIWLAASSIWGNICEFPHILGSPSSYITLQLLHSELEKLDFLFYQGITSYFFVKSIYFRCALPLKLATAICFAFFLVFTRRKFFRKKSKCLLHPWTPLFFTSLTLNGAMYMGGRISSTVYIYTIKHTHMKFMKVQFRWGFWALSRDFYLHFAYLQNAIHEQT